MLAVPPGVDETVYERAGYVGALREANNETYGPCLKTAEQTASISSSRPAVRCGSRRRRSPGSRQPRSPEGFRAGRGYARACARRKRRRRHEGDGRNPELFEMDRVEQTARRARASFGEAVDHPVVLEELRDHVGLGRSREHRLDLAVDLSGPSRSRKRRFEHAGVARKVRAGQVLALVAEKAYTPQPFGAPRRGPAVAR